MMCSHVWIARLASLPRHACHLALALYKSCSPTGTRQTRQLAARRNRKHRQIQSLAWQWPGRHKAGACSSSKQGKPGLHGRIQVGFCFTTLTARAGGVSPRRAFTPHCCLMPAPPFSCWCHPTQGATPLPVAGLSLAHAPFSCRAAARSQQTAPARCLGASSGRPGRPGCTVRRRSPPPVWRATPAAGVAERTGEAKWRS